MTFLPNLGKKSLQPWGSKRYLRTGHKKAEAIKEIIDHLDCTKHKTFAL